VQPFRHDAPFHANFLPDRDCSARCNVPATPRRA
jgi:hypothetical protein